MGDNDLDNIVDEIKFVEEAKEPPEPVEESKETAIVRTTADDLDDRRELIWNMRQRGSTYREIAAEVDVSIATVKRDLDIARRKHREKIEFHDREDYIAATAAQYDDIIREAWKVADGADKETKLKALTTIRQTLDAKRKALQDTGVVRKENQVQETVQIGLVAHLDESNVLSAASALLASQLNLHLGEPTLDIEEAEIVEDEETEDGDEVQETQD